VERVLNHTEGDASAGIRKVYQRWKYEPEKREALTKWGAHLELLLAGSEVSKVAALAQRQRQ
jgi:hypothetical protein